MEDPAGRILPRTLVIGEKERTVVAAIEFGDVVTGPPKAAPN